MKVLVVASGYLPGFRYGGPVRSLASIVDYLGDKIEFRIVTSNRDLGSATPYSNVESDKWTQVGKAHVWYSSGKRLALSFWKRMLKTVQPDAIYLNSFFHPTTAALLLWTKIGLLPNVPILLAPRGEFSKGALELKSRKKRAYISSMRRFHMLRHVEWHVSTNVERDELRRIIPEAKTIHIASNLMLAQRGTSKTPEKRPGAVRLVYIARVSPKKNLLAAIQLLKVRQGKVVFDIYGPIEDPTYWEECLEAVSTLPPNIEVSYRGELSHSEVAVALAGYHFMLMPTLGENFGHSIAEALVHGVPVLISDQTPWTELEQNGVGWALPLEQSEEWSEAISRCIAMDNEEYRLMSENCSRFVAQWMDEQEGIEANRRMFHLAGSTTQNH